MKKGRAEATRRLAAKAENDLRAARILLAGDGPVDSVCFHLQQAAEKRLKAFLTLCGVEYPFTHDLGELLLVCLRHAPVLEKYRATVPLLTDFAVALRYDDYLAPDREDAARDLETIEALKAELYALFPPTAIP